jgi:hypothetical protein
LTIPQNSGPAIGPSVISGDKGAVRLGQDDALLLLEGVAVLEGTAEYR